MSALKEGLGRRLQQLRKAAGLTQERLASRAGIDPKYLGSIERGEKSASLDVLERLMAALDLEPYEPFLFSLKRRKAGQDLGAEALMNLIRRSDASVRGLAVHFVESLMRWNLARKK